jgi:hypothetical protein
MSTKNYFHSLGEIMRIRTLALLSGLLFSGLAHAVTQTNLTLIPEAQKIDVRPNLDFAKVTGKSTAADVDGTSISYGASALYGIDGESAVGLNLGSTNTTAKSKTIVGTSTAKIDGLEPLSIFYRANRAIGLGTLYYNIGYNLEIEKAKDNYATDKFTISNGQNSFDVDLGYIVPMDSLKFGVIAKYNRKLDGEITTTSSGGTVTNNDVKRGDTLQVSALAELENEYHPTLVLDYIKSYLTESKAPGGTADLSGGYSYLGVSLLARYDFLPDVQLVPHLAYLQLLSPKDYGYDSLSGLNVGAFLRLLF